MTLLTACHKSAHSDVPGGGDEGAQMKLSLLFPIGPYASRGGDEAGGLAQRCIVEIYRAGSDVRVKRDVSSPKSGAGESLELTYELETGYYDVYVWLDRVSQSSLADLYYNTSNLRSVALITSGYLAGTPGKEALYAFKAGVDHGVAGSVVRLSLQRPLAKYRLVATDLERYMKLRATDAGKFPDPSELEFEIRYEYFLPSSFSLQSGKPNDSMQGLGYRQPGGKAEGFAEGEALEAGCDYVLAPDGDTFVSLTLTVRDRGGGVVNRCEGVRVDCRRGCLSTVSGNFLSSSHSSGGISVDTEWGDDIVITF